jgi:hypothetical protein
VAGVHPAPDRPAAVLGDLLGPVAVLDLADAPGETGQWHAPSTVERDPALAAARPFFRGLERLHPVESDRVLRARALENIRERPADFARNLAANVTRLLFSVPMRPGVTPLGVAVYVLFNSLLLAGTAWAAVVLWRARGALAPETAPIALFAALGVAVHLPPSASPRMLLPVVPALVWLAAEAWRLRRGGGQPAGPAGTGSRAGAARAARTS